MIKVRRKAVEIDDVRFLKEHPWMRKDVTIRGFFLDRY